MSPQWGVVRESPFVSEVGQPKGLYLKDGLVRGANRELAGLLLTVGRQQLGLLTSGVRRRGRDQSLLCRTSRGIQHGPKSRRADSQTCHGRRQRRDWRVLG
jgi:hypothetical protein